MTYASSLGHFHAYQTINNGTTIVEMVINIWWADERATSHPNGWVMYRIRNIPPITKFNRLFAESFKVTDRTTIASATKSKIVQNRSVPGCCIATWNHCCSSGVTCMRWSNPAITANIHSAEIFTFKAKFSKNYHFLSVSPFRLTRIIFLAPNYT